jgi:hypothetical protein
VLKLEVCDGPLFEAREGLEEARAVLPAILNAADNHNAACHKRLIDDERGQRQYRERQAAKGARDGGTATSVNSHEGFNMDEMQVWLRQYPGGQADWDEQHAHLSAHKELLQQALRRAQDRLNAARAQYDAAKDRCSSSEESALGVRCPCPALLFISPICHSDWDFTMQRFAMVTNSEEATGRQGCLMLVDLAGADYDKVYIHRDTAIQKQPFVFD